MAVMHNNSKFKYSNYCILKFNYLITLYSCLFILFGSEFMISCSKMYGLVAKSDSIIYVISMSTRYDFMRVGARLSSVRQ